MMKQYPGSVYVCFDSTVTKLTSGHGFCLCKALAYSKLVHRVGLIAMAQEWIAQDVPSLSLS